jgi:hypothetical protein
MPLQRHLNNSLNRERERDSRIKHATETSKEGQSKPVMENDTGPRGDSLPLDENNNQDHAQPNEAPAIDTSLDQRQTDRHDSPGQFNRLREALQPIEHHQQLSDVALNGHTEQLLQEGQHHAVQDAHPEPPATSLRQDVIDGQLSHAVGEPQPLQQTAQESHHHQLQQLPGESQFRLQPFLPPLTPGPQISHEHQIQLQAQTGNHQLYMESRNGDMQSMLPATPQHQQHSLPQNLIPQFQNSPAALESPSSPPSQRDGHFSNMKLIPNPPDLQQWREKLFGVDETIVLSEEE